jgi:hypothetical protein
MTKSDIQAEFIAAIEVARRSLEEYQRQPMVPSKRGGDRISPYWQAYREASHIAWRWARLLDADPEAESEFDLLDQVLEEAG